MRYQTLWLALSLCSVVARGQGTSCPQYSGPTGAVNSVIDVNANGHSTGDHSLTTRGAGACTYSGTGACYSSCYAYIPQAISSEIGLVVLYYHGTNVGTAPGGGGGKGAPASCSATSAMTAVQCLAGYACDLTLSVSASYNGLGGSVSYPPVSLWNQSYGYSATCPARFGTSGPPWEGPPSPVVFDTTGKGFHFSDAARGVLFDFYATGHKIQISWPDAGSGNGWLVLPRNADNMVRSALDMFGNLTMQPKSADPNGFLALATFDREDQGGNEDGIIDAHDNVWASLRVWIDVNHDGISQPTEMHTLDSLGIHGIALHYTEDRWKDKYGNAFRYRGHLMTAPDDPVEKVIYDVFLVR